MILAAGLSPAWQQILRFDKLRIGQVNRADEAVWCASGKVINVAVAAQTLGEKVSLISSVGGLSGDAIQQEISQMGLQAEWIHTQEATRVCTTLLQVNGPTTELVENTADTTEAVMADFVDRTRIYANVANITVLSGSLPGNAPPDLFARIMRNTPARFLLDFRGVPLQYCLPFAPFLVKPNRAELEATFGIRLTTQSELLSTMKSLNDGGATWVVVSNGEEGVWITGDDKAWQLLPPKITTINPIGCGDSLAAGIAAELVRHDDVVQAVKFGMGAAAQNAETLIPARLDRERSVVLAEQVQIIELTF
ncbi:1-phosphofructokinase family hexose kinase [Planctomicrobium piriforme]|uniref:Hexose kinase, 1-phosphofructokinase family n=1 Tax=Planctomicrobium piriforme TaxID=1576369 RepID=A0A1I3LAY9_9PLAN|nr:PfkB family carbohydrate kinase [Planctomicrobium piriforme]SFI81962.1 hexose kinase, 1-phosphofructokinase family [Planctomicrobium piriforme]